MLSILCRATSFLLIILVITFWADRSYGSDIYISQSGDNFTLDVRQDGNNHLIRGYHNQTASIQGDNNSLKITQFSSITTSTFSTAHVDINGDNNDIFMGMGVGTTNFTNFTQTDNQEAGNHNQKLYLQGDNNDIYMGQRNGSPGQNYSAHSIDLKIYSDNNDVGIFQGHDGSKTLNLTINNDNNNVAAYQMGYNSAHTATITLDGNYGTNLTLNQNNGYSNSSYSLSQSCMNTNGCSVTVND
mgnify:CR=1 FL=1